MYLIAYSQAAGAGTSFAGPSCLKGRRICRLDRPSPRPLYGVLRKGFPRWPAAKGWTMRPLRREVLRQMLQGHTSNSSGNEKLETEIVVFRTGNNRSTSNNICVVRSVAAATSTPESHSRLSRCRGGRSDLCLQCRPLPALPLRHQGVAATFRSICL